MKVANVGGSLGVRMRVSVKFGLWVVLAVWWYGFEGGTVQEDLFVAKSTGGFGEGVGGE